VKQPENSNNIEQCRSHAFELFENAYEAHMRGDFENAINLYQRSIEHYPTAEAYTFLGWTCSALGQYDNAIENCLKAVRLDPEFGNAYNDIGAYLIELGRHTEATPWLVKAIQARRYECRQFPWFHLGSIYELSGDFKHAKACYSRSLSCCRHFPRARRALERIISMSN